MMKIVYSMPCQCFSVIFIQKLFTFSVVSAKPSPSFSLEYFLRRFCGVETPGGRMAWKAGFVTPFVRWEFINIRGVRLAKNDFGSVFLFGLAKNCGFRFRFGFTKLTAVSVFGSVFWTVLFNVHDVRNDVLLCSIGPTNCRPKWLRTRSAEIRHEEKYVDRWSYHAAK